MSILASLKVVLENNSISQHLGTDAELSILHII